MRWFLTILVLTLFALPLFGQYFAPRPAAEWYWTPLDDEQAALWHRGVQHGVLVLDTLTYHPRFGPGQFGAPVECPCEIPAIYQQQFKQNWREHDVMGGPGSNSIPNSGLHIRQIPKSPPNRNVPDRRMSPPRPPIRQYRPGSVPRGANEVPAYDTMASLTFVSDDGTAADAALATFQFAPELAKARAKYGARAKAYSFADFQQTSAAFKLDQDKRYAQTHFVALVQPDAPDANDKAVVKSIYEFSSAAQFAGALRDADPSYDPNPPPAIDPAFIGEWEPWHIGTAGALGAGILVLLGGIVLHRRRAVIA